MAPAADYSLAPGGAGAVLVAATAADVLWSIGVFVGVPALLFGVLVWREARRMRRQRRERRQDDEAMRQEGYPPGPPVDPPPARQ